MIPLAQHYLTAPAIPILRASSFSKMSSLDKYQRGELAARASFGQRIVIPTAIAAAGLFDVSLSYVRQAGIELREHGDDMPLIDPNAQVLTPPSAIDLFARMDRVEQHEFLATCHEIMASDEADTY